jgi:hypothetical protein
MLSAIEISPHKNLYGYTYMKSFSESSMPAAFALFLQYLPGLLQTENEMFHFRNRQMEHAEQMEHGTMEHGTMEHTEHLKHAKHLERRERSELNEPGYRYSCTLLVLGVA